MSKINLLDVPTLSASLRKGFYSPVGLKADAVTRITRHNDRVGIVTSANTYGRPTTISSG